MLSAAIAAGARRYIGQSFTGWPFAREGSLVKDEDAPLTDDPPKGGSRGSPQSATSSRP